MVDAQLYLLNRDDYPRQNFVSYRLRGRPPKRDDDDGRPRPERIQLVFASILDVLNCIPPIDEDVGDREAENFSPPFHSSAYRKGDPGERDPVSGRRKRAKRNPAYDLDLEEIEDEDLERLDAEIKQRIAQVQATWSEHDREMRSVHKRGPLVIPMTDIEHCGDSRCNDD